MAGWRMLNAPPPTLVIVIHPYAILNRVYWRLKTDALAVSDVGAQVSGQLENAAGLTGDNVKKDQLPGVD